jgi:peptidoglycan/LPS O-acetylase OafA/YrhL
VPEPIKRGQRYVPGLDGLRAIAVLAVLAYHLEIGWAGGGLLGVGVFFTLSGYLITDILLAQAGEGGIRLKEFWLARARRLLPALFVMLIVVLAWVTVIGPHQGPDFRGAVASAALYVNNWWLVFHDVSYFQAFAAPGPLDHLWSLAVEEQFYLLWPLLLIAALAGFRRSRGRLAVATVVLVVASTVLMAVLYRRGLDPSRVYYGTDTRALELLAGAALAMVWPSRRLRPDIKVGARRIVDAGGAVALVAILAMFWRVDAYAPFLYRGGFLLLSLATAVVVAALVHPASRLGPIVGFAPLRWIGERSYGIYLWHFPIIILTRPHGAHGADFTRGCLQVAATIAVAALSWRFVENPIRHGALRRALAYVRARRWRRHRIRRRAIAAMAGAGAIVIAAFAGLGGAGLERSNGSAPGRITLSRTFVAAHTHPRPRAPRTSCRGVVHIGDSTSEGLQSTSYLPNPKQRIAAQFARVGATTSHLEISGARSIYERYKGKPNADEVAAAWRRMHFRGCWVLALGTNEAANVADGSNIGYGERIDMMMDTIGSQHVLWVNVKSLVPRGPYAAAHMRGWNAALLNACRRHPNMRVYDWASDVKDAWFIDDGIHFTTPGYAARARLIANALLEAFPASGGSPASCVVRPGAPRNVPVRAG